MIIDISTKIGTTSNQLTSPIVPAFIRRVQTDGGVVEAIDCLKSALKELN
jgi:hypothetical protein